MFLPYSFFFFIDTATTEIYTLSLHDALPISKECNGFAESVGMVGQDGGRTDRGCPGAESSRCAGFADELAKQDAIPQRSGNSIAGPNQFPSRLLFFIGRKYHKIGRAHV